MTNKNNFQPINVPEQLELPFPKDKQKPSNKEVAEKIKESIVIYALTPPYFIG